MAGGCIDLYNSRRCNFDKCYYWTVDESNNYDLDELVYKSKPNGFFYAKESSAENKNKNNINGMFLFDKSSITIQTNDDVIIKSGDIVKYENEFWQVSNVSIRQVHKNSQFLKKISRKTYIQLRK